MTTERNIIIHAGQTFELSLDYAGTTGRGQRMHIRASDAAADVIAILSHNGDANARVVYDGTDSIDITIGASVNGGWLVGANRVEWVYDIEDYDLSDTDDVVIAYRGKAIVYGNRTRPEDVTPSPALPSGDGRYVRYDGEQGLSDEQKLQARENIGATLGSGDVVGPSSATDDRIAAFDGTTGKLIKQGTVTATAVASHLSNTSNPHSVTAAQVGADPAGTASSAVSAHNALTTGAHGMTSFGASLVDDADASAARTTLGLGTAATAATGDFAAASHTHAASGITSGTLDAARLPAPTTTALGGVKRNTGSAGQFVTGIDTDGSLLRDTPAGGGGLTKFTEAESTSSPNATVYVDSLTANGSSTNVDAAFVPKGTGAVLAAVPDGTATGGNKRGANAVDWQTYRTAATQVASGARSGALSGGRNTVSGDDSVVAGGDFNRATGGQAFVGGGNDNQASGAYAGVVCGITNIASGINSAIGGGTYNTASGLNSWVPGGSRGTTRGLTGVSAYAAGMRAATGDRQHIGGIYTGTTTNSTTTSLTADAGSVGATNVMVLPNNSSLTGLLLVSARDTSGNTASWVIFVNAKRGANAASTTVVYQTTIASDTAALAGVTAAAAADTTQGALVSSVAGLAATTIDWNSELILLQIVR